MEKHSAAQGFTVGTVLVDVTVAVIVVVRRTRWRPIILCCFGRREGIRDALLVGNLGRDLRLVLVDGSDRLVVVDQIGHFEAFGTIHLEILFRQYRPDGVAAELANARLETSLGGVVVEPPRRGHVNIFVLVFIVVTRIHVLVLLQGGGGGGSGNSSR